MTPLGLFYRRIRSRIGGLGAVKATAHQLACLIYRDLQVWPGVRDAVNGRVRGQDEGQHVEGTETEGGGNGLPTQSLSHKSY